MRKSWCGCICIIFDLNGTSLAGNELKPGFRYSSARWICWHILCRLVRAVLSGQNGRVRKYGHLTGKEQEKDVKELYPNWRMFSALLPSGWLEQSIIHIRRSLVERLGIGLGYGYKLYNLKKDIRLWENVINTKAGQIDPALWVSKRLQIRWHAIDLNISMGFVNK